MKQEPPKPMLAFRNFGADAAVHADGPGDLGDIRLRLFTEGGDGVDRGDPLGEEGVGNQFGELAAPDVGGDDLLFRNPVCVDVHQGLSGLQAAVRFPRADEDPVRLFQIADGGSLREKLGVGKDVEADAVLPAVQDSFHRERGPDGKGALFDHDLGGFRKFQNLAGGLFPVLEIGGHPGAEAEGLGRRVHADKDDIIFPDSPFDVRAEEEVPAARRLDKLIQTGLVNGEIVGVPGRDSLGVDVHHRDPAAGAFGGDHRHRGAADITGPDTENRLFKSHGILAK